MRSPFDDPSVMEAVRRAQERQNDPALQHAAREIERQQRDPAYRHMIREVDRFQSDPAYRYMLKDIERRDRDPAYRFLIDEIERRERDPVYRSILVVLEAQRRNNYAETLRNIPDVSHMRDLFSFNGLEAIEQNFGALLGLRSHAENKAIEVLINSDRLQNQTSLIAVLEQVRSAQDQYAVFLAEDALHSQRIRFTPSLAPTRPEVRPADDEQISAELFLIDLQTKCEELQQSVRENERLVIYATFDGLTMEVRAVVADSYNRIRLVGVIGGEPTVVIIKQSEFKLLFRRERTEQSRPKRQIGFIIEEEIENESDD